jgi:type I restriction enzyme, S subunit
LKPKGALPDYFAYLLCKHKPFLEFAIQSMVGTSGRQRIQNDALGQFPVAVPSDAIAHAFGDVVTAAQKAIASNHEQAQTLATLRDTLLPRLISGQLRLPEAEEQLAEAIA